MLGKVHIVDSWSLDVVSFSETSHTHRAVTALHNEYRMYSFSLSVSDPVADKFVVADPFGSFRGLLNLPFRSVLRSPEVHESLFEQTPVTLQSTMVMDKLPPFAISKYSGFKHQPGFKWC